MTVSNPSPQPASESSPRPSTGVGFRGFFDWFPWEKILIWALFLLLVYVLRHFFFIIFMTFMITYIMSNIVKRVTGVLSPGRERSWLQRLVTVVGFVCLLGGLYGAGVFFYHPLKKQFDGLISIGRDLSTNYETRYDELLAKTIGAWRFESVYKGEEGEKKKEEKFTAWKETERPGGKYDQFQDSVKANDRTFKSQVIDQQGFARYKLLQDEGRARGALEDWMLDRIDESELREKLGERRAALLETFESANQAFVLFVEKKNAEKSYDEYIGSQEFALDREKWLRDTFVAGELSRDRGKYVDGFTRELGTQEYERLEKEDLLEERFKEFYAKLAPGLKSYAESYEEFLKLRAAGSREEFEALRFGRQETPEETEARIREEFRTKQQEFLADVFVKEYQDELPFLQISNIGRWLGGNVPVFTQWIYTAGMKIFELSVQFILCLLLSFFITFDLPRLRRGLRTLETSRVSDFYHEIAPGLASFGRLIGRAFQAQGLIAVFNTVLTLLAIRLLGIQYEFFLCSIVFICSFIPVLGVVISSVPVAIMAIIQKEVPGEYPEGSINMALLSVGAILIIHFIETTVLNPKILGEMLHLHPVMVLVILAIGEYFFHVWGLLLGVPIAVFVIRHVILAEDTAVPPSVARGVRRATGIRASPRSEPVAAGSKGDKSAGG